MSANNFEALRLKLEESDDRMDLVEDLVSMLEVLRKAYPETRRVIDAGVRELAEDKDAESYSCETETVRGGLEGPAESCEEVVLWGQEACERHA